MERFKTKYPYTMNPRQIIIATGLLTLSYLLMSIARFIDKDYFFAALFLVCAVLMFIAQYPVFMNNRKGREPPFNGIIIDEEKISICHAGYGQTKEILLHDIHSMHLNNPYNDTFEITMKDHKNIRVPLYWFVEEEQNKIKEILKDYLN